MLLCGAGISILGFQEMAGDMNSAGHSRKRPTRIDNHKVSRVGVGLPPYSTVGSLE